MEKPTPDEFPQRRRLWIWGRGPELYQQQLKSAFPSLNFQPVQDAEIGSFDWLSRAEGVSDEAMSQIEACLHAFCRTLCVETGLHECFALSWHSKPGKPGKPALTALGDLVHLAKSYDLNPDSAGSLPAAGLIAEQMVEFVRRHPLYRHSEGIVAALPSNPEKAFDLPHELAKLVSEDTSIPFLDAALVKKRRTAQMKCCPVLADKLDNITDSVGVREGGAAGKNLILIDDILESGATIQETAQALSRAGARRICGLVATKTLRCTFK